MLVRVSLNFLRLWERGIFREQNEKLSRMCRKGEISFTPSKMPWIPIGMIHPPKKKEKRIIHSVRKDLH